VRYPDVPGSHIYHQFVILAAERDRLRAFLQAQGIGTEVYYPVPFHRQQCFVELGFSDDDFPVANKAAAQSLALPMFAELSEDETAAVVEAIAAFSGSKALRSTAA